MIRKFNYTQRKKILVKHARCSTVRESLNKHHLNISLALGDYLDGIPDTAVVFVEAYTRSKVERFLVGEAGACRDIVSGRFPLGMFSDVEVENMHFRVKIVDVSGNAGRILAMADRLPRAGTPEYDEMRKSILGVDYEDMGDRLWRLDVDRADMPYLIINKNIIRPVEMVKNDDMFGALVFPEVVRLILDEVVMVSGNDYADTNDPDDWRALWCNYAYKLNLHTEIPRTQEDRKDWVEDCVRMFCLKHKYLGRINTLRETNE